MHARLSRVIAAGAVSTGLLFVGAAPLPATALPAAAAVSSSSKATAGASRTTTANLNLRTGPGTSYRVIKVLRKGVRVVLTGRTGNGFSQVRNGSGTGWVSTRYLSAVKVAAKPAPRSAAIPRGLKPNAAKTARAAVAKFPRIRTVYGVRSGGGDHSTGRAVDLMIPSYKSASGRRLGGDVAAWARANARSLGISYVIWDQRIWSVGRSREGWRRMAGRGSDSANHKNHVHISVR